MSYVLPWQVHRMCTPSCRRNRVLFRPPTCRHVMTGGIARTRSVTQRLTASQPPPALSWLRWCFFGSRHDGQYHDRFHARQLADLVLAVARLGPPDWRPSFYCTRWSRALCTCQWRPPTSPCRQSRSCPTARDARRAERSTNDLELVKHGWLALSHI